MDSECEGTRGRLSDHLEGELAERERTTVSRHLARCPECGPVFGSLARAVAGLRSLGAQATPGPSVLPAVLEQIAGRSLRAAIGICLERTALRRTATIALVVGLVLTAVNQLDVLLSGGATWVTGLKVLTNFAVPFVVSNLGLLAAQPWGRMAR